MGNGDPNSRKLGKPVSSEFGSRSLLLGAAMVYVRETEAGEVKIEASSVGLDSSTLVLPVKSVS